MYQALYRKWRPQTFNDVAGQQNITATLAHEVESGQLSHAYLFTGSRGTGKTTCAKILAKAINCLHPVNGNPCNKCEICLGIDSGAILDVSEIDAASNNGVDNIRELIDETNFTPVQAKKRIYIVDEVHMLSTPACNAFLKTLEEPPDHVVFILATTDPHKLLITVRSRCQRFDFKRISPEDITGRLKYIADREGIKLEDDAALLIARIADGAMRDAISMLDLCSANEKFVTAKTVSSVAGLADKSFLFELTDCIKTYDTGRALEIINELHKNFSDMDRLCSELINHLRNLMIIKTVISADSLIVCTKDDYINLKQQAGDFNLEEILCSLFLLEQTSVNLTKGVNKRTELEMAVIKLCNFPLNFSNETLTRKIPASAAAPSHSSVPEKKPEPALKNNADAPSANLTDVIMPISAEKSDSSAIQTLEPTADESSQSEEIEEKYTPQAVEIPVTENLFSNDPAFKTPDLTINNDLPFDVWPDVLKELYANHQGLWGWLNGSNAFIDGETLKISVNKAEALETFLAAGNHMAVLKETVFNVCGKNHKLLVCENKIFKNSRDDIFKGFKNKMSELSNE